MKKEMWLARDKYNGLFLYIGAAPMRKGGNEFWYFDKLETTSVQLPDALFPEVKWSDEEPTKVKLVIGKQNGIQERQTNREPNIA